LVLAKVREGERVAILKANLPNPPLQKIKDEQFIVKVEQILPGMPKR
jgi:hypothetical protein